MNDWRVIVRPPLLLHNALPVLSRYCLFERGGMAGGPLRARHMGSLRAWETMAVHTVDMRQQVRRFRAPQLHNSASARLLCVWRFALEPRAPVIIWWEPRPGGEGVREGALVHQGRRPRTEHARVQQQPSRQTRIKLVARQRNDTCNGWVMVRLQVCLSFTPEGCEYAETEPLLGVEGVKAHSLAGAAGACDHAGRTAGSAAAALWWPCDGASIPAGGMRKWLCMPVAALRGQRSHLARARILILQPLAPPRSSLPLPSIHPSVRPFAPTQGTHFHRDGCSRLAQLVITSPTTRVLRVLRVLRGGAQGALGCPSRSDASTSTARSRPTAR